jgi:hypothetical protein
MRGRLVLFLGCWCGLGSVNSECSGPAGSSLLLRLSACCCCCDGSRSRSLRRPLKGVTVFSTLAIGALGFGRFGAASWPGQRGCGCCWCGCWWCCWCWCWWCCRWLEACTRSFAVAGSTGCGLRGAVAFGSARESPSAAGKPPSSVAIRGSMQAFWLSRPPVSPSACRRAPGACRRRVWRAHGWSESARTHAGARRYHPQAAQGPVTSDAQGHLPIEAAASPAALMAGRPLCASASRTQQLALCRARQTQADAGRRHCAFLWWVSMMRVPRKLYQLHPAPHA